MMAAPRWRRRVDDNLMVVVIVKMAILVVEDDGESDDSRRGEHEAPDRRCHVSFHVTRFNDEHNIRAVASLSRER